MTGRCPKNAVRVGFSLLELQVAFVIFGIALAGLGPLVVTQSRQLRELEGRFDDQTTYYLVPSSSVWSRKLGVPAALQTTDPGPITTTGLTFEAHVNFQRFLDPDPGAFGGDDYLADAGELFADRGNGYSYGWNVGNTADAANRNSDLSPDERYDTLNRMRASAGTATWEIAVPNDTYRVRLVAGDPKFFDSVYKINVEGVLFVDGVPDTNNRWVEGTGIVTVTDGRLTVSNAPGAWSNKICFVDIGPPYQVRILSVDKSFTGEEITAHLQVVP